MEYDYATETGTKVIRTPAEQITVSTIHCDEAPFEHLEPYDHVKHAVPPVAITDAVVLTSGVVRDSADMFFQRVGRPDMWIVYAIILVVNLLIIASAVSGYLSDWYKNLTNTNVNPIVTGVLWLIASALSFVSIFMLWKHVQPDEIADDLIISTYFLIGGVLTLAWSAVFFQGNQIIAAMWLAGLTFLYYFWLMIHIWYIRVRAAIFLMPLVAMYGYLFYSMIHLAALNGIIV